MTKELESIIKERELIKKEFCEKESKITCRNVEIIEKEIDTAIRDMNLSDNIYVKYVGFQEGKTEIKYKEKFEILSHLPGYLAVDPDKIGYYLQGYLMATGNKEKTNEIRTEAIGKIVKRGDKSYWGGTSCTRHCIYQ